MSTDTQTFMQIVQATDDQPQAFERPNTFMRYCGNCKAMTMFYRRANYCECAECGGRVYKGERGSALLEFIFWLGVVLVVLIVLKDIPW
jgi:hypothetical protein